MNQKTENIFLKKASQQTKEEKNKPKKRTLGTIILLILVGFALIWSIRIAEVAEEVKLFYYDGEPHSETFGAILGYNKVNAQRTLFSPPNSDVLWLTKNVDIYWTSSTTPLEFQIRLIDTITKDEKTSKVYTIPANHSGWKHYNLADLGFATINDFYVEIVSKTGGGSIAFELIPPIESKTEFQGFGQNTWEKQTQWDLLLKLTVETFGDPEGNSP